MRLRALAVSLALAAPFLGGAAPASAGHNLWATVNVCDTDAHPDMLGVRGRMPGDGSRDRMYMKFKAQYRRGREWVDVGGKGTSPWLYAGSAQYVYREIGYTFEFKPPGDGTSWVLRGRVTYEWRERRRVNGTIRWVPVYRRHETTEAGHRSRDSDPAGFTAAACRIYAGKPPP